MTDLLPSWRNGTTRAAIRSFLDQVDEIPPGDRVDYELSRDADGTAQLLRTNKLAASSPNDGSGKRPNILRVLGRRPCVAGGNSAGHAEMLEYAKAYDGPSLALLVNHDGAEPEYAHGAWPGPLPRIRRSPTTRLGWSGP